MVFFTAGEEETLVAVEFALEIVVVFVVAVVVVAAPPSVETE